MRVSCLASRLIPATLLIPWIAVGCSTAVEPDERLADVTQKSLEQQARQNEFIADQAKSVANQSQSVVATAKELVQSDAEARREMIEATSTLNESLHTERQSIDRQHENLDNERKELAEQRHRDPVIANALKGVGLLLVCLLPLIVCFQVLRQMRDETGDDKALAELLITEIASANPLFLPETTVRPSLENAYKKSLPELRGDSTVDQDTPPTS